MVFKKLDFFSAFDTSRPRQMIDIQYGITIMGGREVSRPYQVGFCFVFVPQNLSTEPLYGGVGGKKKKTHIDSLGFSSG